MRYRIHAAVALSAAALFLSACNDGGTRDAPARLVGFRVLSPSRDGVANQDRPLVRWTAVPDADRYHAFLYDDGFRLLEQRAVESPEVRFDARLAEGGVYWVRFSAVDRVSGDLRSSDLSRFRVRVVPDWMPQIAVQEHGSPLLQQGGYRLFNLFDLDPPSTADRIPALVLVNAAGEVVWWHVADRVGTITDARLLPNGNFLYAILYQTPTPELRARAFEVTWDGDVVWRSPEDTLVHHEVGLGPDGHVLALTWVYDEGMPGVTFEGDGLVLWDRATNQELWSWNIFDHFPPAQWPTLEQKDPGLSQMGRDWSHANAAVWDERRGLIWMSVRHFDAVIGIGYPSGDVEVVLGKRGIGGDDLLRHQHAPEVQEDGSLLIYDNGNFREPPFTRVVQVGLDEQLTSAEVLGEWIEPGVFEFAVGDSDRLPNGNLLITHGVHGRITEVTPAGDLLWELAIHAPGRTGPARYWIYRAEYVRLDQVPTSVLPFGR